MFRNGEAAQFSFGRIKSIIACGKIVIFHFVAYEEQYFLKKSLVANCWRNLLFKKSLRFSRYFEYDSGSSLLKSMVNVSGLGCFGLYPIPVAFFHK